MSIKKAILPDKKGGRLFFTLRYSSVGLILDFDRIFYYRERQKKMVISRSGVTGNP